MNQQLSMKEVDAMFGSIIDERPVMTRRDKLLHWADLVRGCRHDLFIFHSLERWNSIDLANATHPQSAFALAARDPKLQAAGLKGGSALQSMEFFALTQSQLHEFSCDCSGQITPHEMANRIQQLAG